MRSAPIASGTTCLRASSTCSLATEAVVAALRGGTGCRDMHRPNSDGPVPLGAGAGGLVGGGKCAVRAAGTVPLGVHSAAGARKASTVGPGIKVAMADLDVVSVS